MSTSWTGQQRSAAVHTFMAGDHSEDADGIALRITASVGYRTGLVPADPVLQRAATFGYQPSTQPGVYVTDGHSEPTQWLRFDDVVALLATDGSPILRFRASGDGTLPIVFREAAKRTHRILIVDTSSGLGGGRPTVILFTSDAHALSPDVQASGSGAGPGRMRPRWPTRD
jgi:hypothetical protein